jgi:hypothetical protein
MSQVNTPAIEAAEDKTAAKARATVAYLAIYSAVGALLVAAVTYLLARFEVQIPGWSFVGDDALIGHFAGVPGVLAAGWAILALDRLNEQRKLFGAIVTGFFGLALAVVTVVITTAGLQPQTAWVLGGVEAMVAGLWTADLFHRLRTASVLPALAASAWLLISTLLLFQGMLPFVFPVLVALLLTMPLLVAAFNASIHNTPEGMPVGWFAVGVLVQPIVLGTVLWLVRLLLPA